MLSLSINHRVLLIHTENVNACFQNNEEMKLVSAKLTTFSLAEDCRLEKNVWLWYVKCSWQLLLFLCFLSTFHSCLVVFPSSAPPLSTSALSVYSWAYHCKIEFCFTMEVVGMQPAPKKKTLFNLFRTAVQIKTRRKLLIKMKLPATEFCIEFKFLFSLSILPESSSLFIS